jgi:hypothetical protein
LLIVLSINHICLSPAISIIEKNHKVEMKFVVQIYFSRAQTMLGVKVWFLNLIGLEHSVFTKLA